MSAVARFLGWLLIAVAIGGAIGRLLNVLDVSMPTRILALCVFFVGAGAAIIIRSRRSHQKKSEFGPSLPSFDTQHRGLHSHLFPRTPAWAASIEEGVSAFRSNQFSVAASHFTSAESNGRTPLHRFISANNLAAAHCAAQRYAEAEPLYRRLIDMWHVLPAPDDGGSDISLGLNNLALALSGQGRYREAEATLRQALEVRDDEWGDADPADTLENLALVCVARDHAGAPSTSEQANSLDPDALAKRRAQDLGDARLWAECALAIREAELGDHHADLVSSLMTLEEVCRAQGDDQNAIRFRDRARLLCERPVAFDDFDAVARLPRCGLWDSFGRWIEPRSPAVRWLLRKFSASNVDELIGKISGSEC